MIRRGHKFEDLWSRYTMDQVWLFFKAASENSKRETLELAIVSRAAFGADKEGWRKFVQALSPKKVASKVSQVMPKKKYRQIRRILSGKR